MVGYAPSRITNLKLAGISIYGHSPCVKGLERDDMIPVVCADHQLGAELSISAERQPPGGAQPLRRHHILGQHRSHGGALGRVGLVLGAIVGAANGYVQLLWGIVDTGVVGASKPGDYGQLEYRVIPVLVN